MNMLKVIMIILLSNTCIFLYSQDRYDSSKVSGSIKMLAQKLGSDTAVSLNGGHGKIEMPENFPLLHEFISRGKDYEFYELTNHPNPVVRCYAYEALEYSGSRKIIEVLQTHFDDTAKVTTRRGCIIGPEKVIDIMMNLAVGGRMINRTIYPEKARELQSEGFMQRLTEVFEKYYEIRKR